MICKTMKRENKRDGPEREKEIKGLKHDKVAGRERAK